MKKILITEDDPFMANLYRERCQTEGFEVTIADDGRKAIADMQTAAPDLVLLDLMLPETDGVQVLKFMRGQPALKDVPVVVLTNAYAGNMVQAAWKAGANRCLVKATCTPNQLIEEIRGLLADLPTTPIVSAKSPEPRVDTHTTFMRKAQAIDLSMANNFASEAPTLLAQLSANFQRIGEGDETKKAFQWLELSRGVRALGGRAVVAKFSRMAHLCSALEALMRELRAKAERITPSTLRTVAQALDSLRALLAHDGSSAAQAFHPLILVVDDEPICCEAVCGALEKAQLRGVVVGDPSLALNILENNTFDLVFTDVDMPGMNGFELCKRLHSFPSNQSTPVIFVTSLKDFETRAQSILSGGADLIAKPFPMLELAVKTLTYILGPGIRRPQAP